jgi:hypothetical protein
MGELLDESLVEVKVELKEYIEELLVDINLRSYSANGCDTSITKCRFSY